MRVSAFFFFNETATTEIYTLSLHDALPIWRAEIDAGCALGFPFARLGHRDLVHRKIGEDFELVPVAQGTHDVFALKCRHVLAAKFAVGFLDAARDQLNATVGPRQVVDVVQGVVARQRVFAQVRRRVGPILQCRDDRPVRVVQNFDAVPLAADVEHRLFDGQARNEVHEKAEDTPKSARAEIERYERILAPRVADEHAIVAPRVFGEHLRCREEDVSHFLYVQKMAPQQRAAEPEQRVCFRWLTTGAARRSTAAASAALGIVTTANALAATLLTHKSPLAKGNKLVAATKDTVADRARRKQFTRGPASLHRFPCF